MYKNNKELGVLRQNLKFDRRIFHHIQIKDLKKKHFEIQSMSAIYVYIIYVPITTSVSAQ